MPTSLTLMSIQALAFATAAALSALLLCMHWSASRTQPSASNYRWLWLTGFVYAAGAFAATCTGLLVGAGSRPAAVAESIAWISTCFGPLVFAEIGSPHVRAAPVRRALQVLASIACVALAVRFLSVAIDTGFRIGDSALPMHAFYVSAAFATTYAAAAFVDRDPSSKPSERTVALKWFAPTAAALALLQASATLALIHDVHARPLLHTIIELISTLWVLPWTVLLPFFLAQTRYADVALKRSLVVVASVCAAGVFAAWVPGIRMGLSYVVVTLVVAAAFVAGPAIHRAMHWLIDRPILRRPRYRQLERQFAAVARRTPHAEDLFIEATRAIEDALHVDASFRSAAESPAEIDAPHAFMSVPIGGKHALIVQTASGARTLMQEEFSFLERIALQVSHRLESLELEADRRELQLRHERLQRSLTEAELRALRAQVDPHFLFNTLNTIADLVTRNPAQAEAMTERLAECFRYALTRQEQALSTLQDELQFVRRYLDIEQIRFGSRLSVEMRDEENLRGEQVPSLILQPLVENALRHGLAPKPAGGCVSVIAKRSGENLLLEVVDDGVGMSAADSPRVGVGIKNVRERLQLLYRERARMQIQPGPFGRGTRVTLQLPCA